MEMRVLKSKEEREIFSQRVTEARAQFASEYRGICRGPIDNDARLRAATIRALFERDGAPADAMMAGMAIHDLEAFPQSCPVPDLSHLPPESVFECGDHWSLARGAGMHMWCAAAIYLARMKPSAVVVYLAVNPPARMGFYTTMGFVPVWRPTPLSIPGDGLGKSQPYLGSIVKSRMPGGVNPKSDSTLTRGHHEFRN